MIATQQYLSVVLFIMLHKVLSTCYFVDEFLQFAVELSFVLYVRLANKN